MQANDEKRNFDYLHLVGIKTRVETIQNCFWGCWYIVDPRDIRPLDILAWKLHSTTNESIKDLILILFGQARKRLSF